MEQEDLREKYISYIKNKTRKKFLILFSIYQLMFFITVILSLNFQLINIVYLIYCLDVDIIVSIFTYVLIYKKPKKNKNKNKDILMMFSLNVYPEIQFLIDKDDFLIGRKIDSVNGYIENQDVISKIHARIIRVGNNFFIKDEESLNGTYLNDKKINEDDVTPLKIGDIVKLANIEFKIK